MANMDLLGNSQRKSVETPEICIKGNIITWKNTMLQISNISGISISQEKPPFPKFSILLILAGLFFLSIWDYFQMSLFFESIAEKTLFLAIIALFFGIGMIVLYVLAITDQKYYLSIIMNCGLQYQIVIKQKERLSEIMSDLEDIIIKGGVGDQNYIINIENSTLGDVDILNNNKFR